MRSKFDAEIGRHESRGFRRERVGGYLCTGAQPFGNLSLLQRGKFDDLRFRSQFAKRRLIASAKFIDIENKDRIGVRLIEILQQWVLVLLFLSFRWGCAASWLRTKHSLGLPNND